MSAKNDNIKTVTTALVLCLVCSIAVSAVAVGLKPQQQTNATFDLNKNVLIASGLATETTSNQQIKNIFKDFEPKIINLTTGKYASDEELKKIGADNIETFDVDKLLQTTTFRTELQDDPARIKYKPNYTKIYIKGDANKPDLIVLPIRGYGLWGTIYGFLSLQQDLTTIQGISFYKHKETAGLGSRITEAKWRQQFEGKQAYDDRDEVATGVVKSGAAKPNENYVDGISGATLTSRGVNRFLQFWLGDDGYKPFLNHLKQGEA